MASDRLEQIIGGSKSMKKKKESVRTVITVMFLKFCCAALALMYWRCVAEFDNAVILEFGYF